MKCLWNKIGRYLVEQETITKTKKNFFGKNGESTSKIQDNSDLTIEIVHPERIRYSTMH